jgi:apolipoprotein N-acyltransferase
LRFGAVWNAVLLAAFWVLLEYIRGIAFTGFPWLLLSHTQHNSELFIQILDVFGSLGLSGIIAAINVLLYESWRRKSGTPLTVAAAAIAIVFGYGYFRTKAIHLRPSLHVGAVQAAVPQEMKETLEGKYDPDGVLERYVTQSRYLESKKLDLIVWPETIFLFPYTLNINPDALENRYANYARLAQNALRDLAVSRDTYVLAGASTYLPAELGYVADPARAAKIPAAIWDQRYNSAVLVNTRGEYVDRYDKMHLVPFGEYVPLANVFPFLTKLVPFDESLIAGERLTIFKVPGNSGEVRFGVLICYEDADAELARRIRQSGADFLVNLSNDAWFGEEELKQHFVAAQYRAIENRMGVLRNGNNGITGIIDPLGRVQNRLGRVIDGKFVMRDVMGHLEGEVFITDAHSIYSRIGDTPVALVCAVIVVLSALMSRRTSTIKNSKL